MTRALLALAIGTLAAGPAYGHHSFRAVYLEDQTVTIRGEVVEFHYRNPHAILVIAVTDADGRVQTYAAEWLNAGRLAAQGVMRDTLKPGDHVVVVGSPGKVASEYKVHLKAIGRPADGWFWNGRNF